MLIAIEDLNFDHLYVIYLGNSIIPFYRGLFDQDLNPHRIVNELSLFSKQAIIPGKTLLFFDEIQIVPQGITALRYFYEKMPELHVIAAGSLLDFAIEQVGVPVGRAESLYMYPLSFIEYLAAMNESMVIKKILDHSVDSAISPLVHQKIVYSLKEYFVFGGMPQAIYRWSTTNDALQAAKSHAAILEFYQQDFNKYARKNQIKYVQLIFDEIPVQLGQKFKYSAVEGDYRKRELAPALDLLVTAGVAHKVYYSPGQGVPLGAQRDPLNYKAIFLDVGLAQSHLGVDLAAWFLQPDQQFINKRSLVEAFVGQELIAYASPLKKHRLYYWHKESSAQQAEIDYLIQLKDQIVPVEVKSGEGRTLKSLHYFLENHKQSPYGIKFSNQNYSILKDKEKDYIIHSYPLYAIAKVVSDAHPDLKAAIGYLIEN
jgi:predicted AAA+ superfamily ATPase